MPKVSLNGILVLATYSGVSISGMGSRNSSSTCFQSSNRACSHNCTKGCSYNAINYCNTSRCSVSHPSKAFAVQKTSFGLAIKLTEYRKSRKEIQNYDVFLFNDDYHWYLLVHASDTDDAYVSLEVTTDKKGKTLIAEMKVLYGEGDKLTTIPESSDDGEIFTHISNLEKRGSVRRSIEDICKLADSVKDEMKGYRLATSNCQQFCNNVLQRLELPITPTWIGPDTTVPV